MSGRLAVLITSIGRPDLLLGCVKAWRKELPKSDIYVAEQGTTTASVSGLVKQHYCLPWNSGICVGRNHLVRHAHKDGHSMVLLAADSLYPGTGLDRLPAAQGLIGGDYSLIGFGIEGRGDWTYDMSLGKTFELVDISKRKLTGEPRHKACDICCNFFLATSESLLDTQWDEHIKAGEHQDFFWRYRQNGYKCLWTPEVKAHYVRQKDGEYGILRSRNIAEGDRYICKKYNLEKSFRLV